MEEGLSSLKVSSSLALRGEMSISMKAGLHQPDPNGRGTSSSLKVSSSLALQGVKCAY